MESEQQQTNVEQGSRYGSRSRQYLTAMGIDIWQVRAARAAIEPSEAEKVETSPVAAPASSANHAGQTRAGGVDSKGSRESLLKQVSANVIPEPPLSDVAERPLGQSLSQPLPVTPQTSVRLEFLLYFMNYDAFTVVFALPYATAEMPATYPNFLEGISLSLLRERVSPSIRQLRWPIVKASHIDQSEHEARQIVRDSLRQSQRQAKEPTQDLKPVLVFGQEAWRYLVEDSEKTAFHVGDTEQEASCLFLALPTIDAVSQDVTLKRQLWRQLSPVRAILHG
ncbi:MAG: hypothetical protein P8N51_09075 [Pseudomonadales bacterium]|nr:hypothetical protein [Pseudomonadales bacterium]MDG1444009.1 hypothetical protein [Pseudomonadales bacterium]